MLLAVTEVVGRIAVLADGRGDAVARLNSKRVGLERHVYYRVGFCCEPLGQCQEDLPIDAWVEILGEGQPGLIAWLAFDLVIEDFDQVTSEQGVVDVGTLHKGDRFAVHAQQ